MNCKNDATIQRHEEKKSFQKNLLITFGAKKISSVSKKKLATRKETFKMMVYFVETVSHLLIVYTAKFFLLFRISFEGAVHLKMKKLYF